jgi:transposase
LAKHFTVVDVPEGNTTKRCFKCEKGEMCPAMKREVPKWNKDSDKLVDVRGIRRCNNADCGVLMNRDYNAAMNIRKNLLYRIEHEGWHPCFADIE